MTSRLPIGLLSLLLLTSSLQAAVTGRVLRCESVDEEHQYCLAYVRSGVKLVRQLSLKDCRYQDSWGYDSGGIWVDKGCRAEFFIRDTQRLEDILNEPDSGVTELMSMTVVAEMLNKGRLPDWSYSPNNIIDIGVDYNTWYYVHTPDSWQDFWFFPAFLRIKF